MSSRARLNALRPRFDAAVRWGDANPSWQPLLPFGAEDRRQRGVLSVASLRQSYPKRSMNCGALDGAAVDVCLQIRSLAIGFAGDLAKCHGTPCWIVRWANRATRGWSSQVRHRDS